MKPFGEGGWCASTLEEPLPQLTDAARCRRAVRRCDAVSPSLVAGLTLTHTCCRVYGHTGRHRADGTGGRVMAVWA